MGTDDKSTKHATKLLSEALVHVTATANFLQERHPHPFDALVTAMFTAAAIAKGLEMPLETLVEGVVHAYESLEVGERGRVQ